jgi:hypothetical protein
MKSPSDKPNALGADKQATNQHSASQHADNQQLAQKMNQVLTHSIDNLSPNTLSDIAQARANALAKLDKNRARSAVNSAQKRWHSNNWLNLGVPVAAVVLLGVSVKYLRVESVPALPLAMMSAEIPTEDLAMLEELEFVTWLAENEPNALL